MSQYIGGAEMFLFPPLPFPSLSLKENQFLERMDKAMLDYQALFWQTKDNNVDFTVDDAVVFFLIFIIQEFGLVTVRIKENVISAPLDKGPALQ